MNRVYVLAEGQTEQAFVRDVLTPSLSAHDTYPSAVLLGKPGHKGGIRSFAVVQREISNLLKQDADAPDYRKGKGINADLPRICTEVGLQRLRDACPLLNRWVEQLESLA